VFHSWWPRSWCRYASEVHQPVQLLQPSWRDNSVISSGDLHRFQYFPFCCPLCSSFTSLVPFTARILEAAPSFCCHI
jgi:hypothetical protein